MNRRDTALRYFDENRDFMDSYVNAQIEQNRKGNIRISAKDKDGNPVSGAKIKIKQKNHDFRYGANIFMLDEFETYEKNKIYRNEFAKTFNLATIPFYWDAFEPQDGKPRFAADSEKIYRRPPSDLCVNYCLENGIEPKCHCLNYDAFIPTWLKDADVDTHKKILERHFQELAEHYVDIIPSWEVTNETLQNNHEIHTKFFQEDDFVEWSFRMADRYFPNNRLIINECDVFEEYGYWHHKRTPYYMQLELLLRNGITHLDSIGLQFHCFGPKDKEEYQAKMKYNPVYLYELLNMYAKLGKKLQITEMTIPAYSNSEEDEAVQAELFEKIYKVFFSHPAMEAAIYWNVVDGYAAFAPQGDMTKGENIYYSGIRRFDLSEKPASKVLKNLFQNVWHTEAESTTDDGGFAEMRGFYGEYDAEITHNGTTKTLTIPISSKRNNKFEIIV